MAFAAVAFFIESNLFADACLFLGTGVFFGVAIGVPRSVHGGTPGMEAKAGSTESAAGRLRPEPPVACFLSRLGFGGKFCGLIFAMQFRSFLVPGFSE